MIKVTATVQSTKISHLREHIWHYDSWLTFWLESNSLLTKKTRIAKKKRDVLNSWNLYVNLLVYLKSWLTHNKWFENGEISRPSSAYICRMIGSSLKERNQHIWSSKTASKTRCVCVDETRVWIIQYTQPTQSTNQKRKEKKSLLLKEDVKFCCPLLLRTTLRTSPPSSPSFNFFPPISGFSIGFP